MMKIPGDKIRPLLAELQKSRRLIAPVEVDGVVLFKEVDGAGEVLLDYQNSVVPPKDWFFAQSEDLFYFENRMDELRIEEAEREDDQFLLFGIRPCDARSILLLDHVFCGQEGEDTYSDDYYRARRENTILVGLSCQQPLSSCFCTAFDGSPASREGCDLLLTELEGENYLVEAVTERGSQLLEAHASFFSPADEVDREALEEELKSRLVMDQLSGVYDQLPALYESDYWDKIAARCLGCGVCTYVCPTCHCFDIFDESKGQGGRRIRTWDSCMYANFTRMTSGENPRPSQKERVRQRFFHKLRYFEERYQDPLCVGCGRCIEKCPVNIDISQIISEVKELA